MVNIRSATEKDLLRIMDIYNQGIEDRIATLETVPKDMQYIETWFKTRKDQHIVLVAESENEVVGWAALNSYSERAAYDGVGSLSIYIDRISRGKGIGKRLLMVLEEKARQATIHKIVLFTFPFNQLGQGLYKKLGYREVGIFREQGKLDNKYVDVMAMEKVIRQNELP